MTGNKGKILFVEDDKLDRIAFERFATQEDFPFDYAMVESVKQAAKIINTEEFDAIVMDYMLEDGTAFDLLGRTHDVPVIFITGAGDQEIAVKAMKAGACDYLIKDSQYGYLKTLTVTIESAIHRKRTETELARYQEQLEASVKERT